MSDWTSISVDKDTADRFHHLKDDYRHDELTSDEFLNALLTNWEYGPKTDDEPIRDVPVKVVAGAIQDVVEAGNTDAAAEMAFGEYSGSIEFSGQSAENMIDALEEVDGELQEISGGSGMFDCPEGMCNDAFPDPLSVKTHLEMDHGRSEKQAIKFIESINPTDD